MESLVIENINPDLIEYLENLCNEIGCHISRKEWKSKYNSYVVYDYEPFCSDGFIVNFEIQGVMNRLVFISYLYEKRCEAINFLNKCLQIPPAQIEPSRPKRGLDYRPVVVRRIVNTWIKQ